MGARQERRNKTDKREMKDLRTTITKEIKRRRWSRVQVDSTQENTQSHFSSARTEKSDFCSFSGMWNRYLTSMDAKQIY